MNRKLAAALVAVTVALSACGGARSDTAAQDTAAAPTQDATQDSATVEVVNIAFQPTTLKVLRGTEVTWRNGDAGVRHTATSGSVGDNGVPGVSKATPARADGMFDGDLPDAGSEFAFTFTTPGTYAYFCEIHPSMTAEVVVE